MKKKLSGKEISDIEQSAKELQENGVDL